MTPSARPPSATGIRVLFVHAHPDDEAITTGGTIAQLVRRGADVTVVTCTLGELGEVIGEPYQGLVGGDSDQLGGFRVHELHAALAALGCNGPGHAPVHLGGAGRWRDSGMVGDPGNDAERAFIRSGDEALGQLTEVLGALRPHVVITYDADGGYGHTSSLYLDVAAGQTKLEAFRDRMKTCRILVNTPSSHGGIGDLYNFQLAPSLTLGCGSVGGSATSDNVGPMNLINVRRLAYGLLELEDLRSGRAEMVTTLGQLQELHDAVPGAFEASKADYLAEIDARGPRIEAAFQGGLNAGFRDLYILFAGACALTLGVLLLVGRGPHHPAAPPTATVPDDAA